MTWLRGMARAHAKLDAYAHNPYPLRPGETPSSHGCRFSPPPHSSCTPQVAANRSQLGSSLEQFDWGPESHPWLKRWPKSDTDPRGELDTFKVLVKFECITSDESAGTKRQTNGRSYLWCYPLLLSVGELSAQWWRSPCLRYGNIRLNIHPPCRVTFLNFQTRSPARRFVPFRFSTVR